MTGITTQGAMCQRCGGMLQDEWGYGVGWDERCLNCGHRVPIFRVPGGKYEQAFYQRRGESLAPLHNTGNMFVNREHRDTPVMGRY